jgi:hypothetical protein
MLRSTVFAIAVLCCLSPLAVAQETVTLEDAASYVQLASGDYIVGEVAVEPASGVPMYLEVDGQRFPRHYVRAYRINGTEYAISFEDGARPILLERRSNGRASLYHEAGYPSGIDFFRVGDGPVDLASPANLREAFQEHPVAMRHLRADRRYAATGFAAIALGAALVGTGTVLELTDQDALPGMMIAASGVALAVGVNALVPILRQHHRRSAIRAFNE